MKTMLNPALAALRGSEAHPSPIKIGGLETAWISPCLYRHRCPGCQVNDGDTFAAF